MSLLQSANAPLQAPSPHMPATQFAVALSGFGHSVPHPPQFKGSIWMS
jgi:hypothetical protein